MGKRENFFKKLFSTTIRPKESEAEIKPLACSEDLKQKTELLQLQNEKLNDIAWIVSHKVRGPVASIVGLSRLFNHNNLADPDNEKILNGIHSAANELDIIIKEVVAKTSTKDKKRDA